MGASAPVDPSPISTTNEFSPEWSGSQCALYRRVYLFMMANQQAFRHPAGPMLGLAHWQTICHNAAFACAEFIETDDLTITGEGGEILASTPHPLVS